ncbi:MAG: MFS transporter, partial [Actinomycetota bacterium]
MSLPVSTQIRRALVAVLIARTAANAGLRIVYPFLPTISRGLGVSIATLSVLIAVRNLGGVAAPLAARTAETIGRRSMMTWAMGTVAVGTALTAIAPGFAVAGIGIVLVGLAKPAFDVPMQGWFGDRVPYERRGRILGITELTWSVALLVTVPVSGFLIAATSWRAPFVLISVMAVAGTIAIFVGIGDDRPPHRTKKPLKMTAPRVTILALTLLFSVAAELVFIVYGQWLEDSFGLSVAAIGLFTIAVVVAEMIGEGLVTWFGDRVGPHRMILLGLLVSVAAYGALGLVGGSIALAVVVVIAWLLSFEITIVATIPLVSELATESRDRLLSLLAVL